jgi:hypothetical protein
MAEKDKRYRVTARLTVDYELSVKAINADEARLFAGSIDKDKWIELISDWQVNGVAISHHSK